MANHNDFCEGKTSLKRVLLLDDDSVVRDALSNALRSRQHFVFSVSDVEEAMEKLSGARIDVALVASHGVNGRAWQKAERLASKYPDLAIILLTTGQAAIPPALASRALASFQKPLLDLEQLLETISGRNQEVLSQRLEVAYP